jgi:integrase
MAELATKGCIGARMLETCILTCARTNEIINMKWSQIDLDKATWTLPAEMMKMDRDHIVPLSGPVMTFLQSAYEMRYGDYVFPGRNRGEPMSNMTMLELLADMGRDVTVHGFRATFRTWADEETEFSNQAVEFCIAHVPGGDEAEKVYRRRSMLAKRKQIMDAWARFATKPPTQIISIESKQAA